MRREKEDMRMRRSVVAEACDPADVTCAVTLSIIRARASLWESARLTLIILQFTTRCEDR